MGDAVAEIGADLARARGEERGGPSASPRERGVKRVAMVVWRLGDFGGLECHVTELACALRRAGVRVTLLSELPLAPSNFYARKLRAAGVSVQAPPRALERANEWRRLLCRLTRGRFPRVDTGDEMQRLVEGDLLSNWLMRTLERTGRSGGRPDVVHVHGCQCGQAWLLRWARRNGIASVYTEHTAISEYGGPFDANGPELVAQASALACVSEHARRDLLALLPEARPVSLSAHIVRVGQNGTRAQGTAGGLMVLCAARLEHYKGIDVLLRAWAAVRARHESARLVIAGDGSLRAALSAMARELGLDGSVAFLGQLAPDALEAELHAADVVVLPSRSEGLPLVVMEAMAAGKPLVATTAGGVPEVVRAGENGILVQPDSPDCLAAALDAVLADANLRGVLAAGARRTFERSRYHEPVVVRETLDLYRQAMDHATRHAPAGAAPAASTRVDEKPTVVIAPEAMRAAAGLREAWEYRDLLLLLARRDIKLRYQQTAVGFTWALLQPLLIMLVLSGFASLLGLRTGRVAFPLYAISGLVPWTYFVHGFTQTTYSLTSNSGMLSKIYFPRILIPFAAVVGGAVDFFVAALLLPVFMFYYGATPTAALLALPAFVVMALAAALALGLWLAVLNVRYRDVGNALPFFTQLLFFTTPIAFPADLVPEPWRTVAGLNPMFGVVEGFRWALLGGRAGPFHGSVIVSALVIAVLLGGGLRYFQSQEANFADEL